MYHCVKETNKCTLFSLRKVGNNLIERSRILLINSINYLVNILNIPMKTVLLWCDDKHEEKLLAFVSYAAQKRPVNSNHI